MSLEKKLFKILEFSFFFFSRDFKILPPTAGHLQSLSQGSTTSGPKGAQVTQDWTWDQLQQITNSWYGTSPIYLL